MFIVLYCCTVSVHIVIGTDYDLAAIECLKSMYPLFSVAINPILFKSRGNLDLHNILHEFEFWPDGSTFYRLLLF